MQKKDIIIPNSQVAECKIVVESSVKEILKSLVEEIRFPEDFEVHDMEKGAYCTIVSSESSKWEVGNLYILVGIKYHGTGYEAIICIGKDVDQIFGDRNEVLERINYHVCNFFRKKANEKGLYYRY